MGNPLAVTDPRGFTTRYDRNELGEVYRTISPQPYNFRVETYFDANRNVDAGRYRGLSAGLRFGGPVNAAYAAVHAQRAAATRPTSPCGRVPAAACGPAGSRTSITFDLLDDKIEEDIDATGSTPASLVTTFLYDPNQNLIQITKPRGQYRRVRLRRAEPADRRPGGSGQGLCRLNRVAVTVTAYDANGNVLQVIGPADRGGDDRHGHDRGCLPRRQRP